MDLRTSTFMRLNSTASRLWEALVEGTTERRLAELLAGLGVDGEAARGDAAAFVESLRERDLLR